MLEKTELVKKLKDFCQDIWHRWIQYSSIYADVNVAWYLHKGFVHIHHLAMHLMSLEAWLLSSS